MEGDVFYYTSPFFIIMKRQDFEKIINKLQFTIIKCDVANSSGIDIVDFVNPFYSVISTFFESYFGEYVRTIIEWYLYEYKAGEMKILDSKTEEVLYDFDQEGDLWKFVVENNANAE